MFKFVFLGLELIEIIVALLAILFCFYLFMEFVFPFFTLGAIKPGWLFFSKYQERKAAKKAAQEEAAKVNYQTTKEKPKPEVEVTEEPNTTNEGDTGTPPTEQ